MEEPRMGNYELFNTTIGLSAAAGIFTGLIAGPQLMERPVHELFAAISPTNHAEVHNIMSRFDQPWSPEQGHIRERLGATLGTCEGLAIGFPLFFVLFATRSRILKKVESLK